MPPPPIIEFGRTRSLSIPIGEPYRASSRYNDSSKEEDSSSSLNKSLWDDDGPSPSSSSSKRTLLIAVSESEVLYGTGNELRVLSLPTSTTTSPGLGGCGQLNGDNNAAHPNDGDGDGDVDVLDDDRHFAGATDSAAADASSSSIAASASASASVWAVADSGRGISCFDRDSRSGHMAYSPRRTNPDIIVVQPSLQHRCKKKKNAPAVHCLLAGGATIEYADVSISRNGEKVASIGRGAIDAKLWIWRLPPSSSTTGTDSHNDERPPSSPSSQSQPMVAHDLPQRQPCVHCAFDPWDDNRIGLLRADGSAVVVCHLSSLCGGGGRNDRHVRVKEVLCAPPTPTPPTNSEQEEEHADTKITTFAWETNHRIVAGTSIGSLLVFDATTGRLLQDVAASFAPRAMSTISSPSPPVIDAAVQHIVVTLRSILVVYADGTLHWRSRSRHIDEETKYEDGVVLCVGEVMHEVRLETSLLDITCTPNFESFIGLSSNGIVHRFPAERTTNKLFQAQETSSSSSSSSECTTHSSAVAQLPGGIVTSVTNVMLAGKTAAASSAVLVTGSTDGGVVAWKDPVVQSQIHDDTAVVVEEVPTVRGRMHLSSSVTAMTSLVGYPMVVIGTADGTVRFVHCSKNKRGTSIDDMKSEVDEDIAMTIVKEMPMPSNHVVTSFVYNFATKKVAAKCLDSTTAYVFCTEPNNLCILGTAETHDGEQQLASVMWCHEKSSHLFLVGAGGAVSCVDTSNMHFDLDDPTPPQWRTRLPGTPPNSVRQVVNVATSSSNSKFSFWVLHKDVKGVICYSSSHNDAVSSSDDTPPAFEEGVRIEQGMSKSGSILASSSSCSDVVASGSMSGDVLVLDVRDGDHDQGEGVAHCSQAIHNGPVVALTFSHDGSQLFTSGVDGSFFVHHLLGSSPRKSVPPSKHEYDYLLEDAAAKHRDGRTCDAKNREQGDIDCHSHDLREELRQRKDRLAGRVKTMIQDNEARDEREKLTLEDFLIDVGGKERHKEAVEREAQELRSRIIAANAENDAMSERIRKEAWEVMDAPSCAICHIVRDAGPCVWNVPLRKRSAIQMRRYEVVKRLRLCEIKEIQRRSNKASRRGVCWAGFLDETPTSGNLVVDPSELGDLDGFMFPTTNGPDAHEIDEDIASDTDSDDAFDRFIDLGDDCPAYSLLYPPLAVRTDGQRHTQIALVEEINRGIAERFNVRFDRLRNEKNFALDQIAAANERIKEISIELGVEADCFEPFHCQSEVPNHMLQLNDDEMLALKRCEGGGSMASGHRQVDEKESAKQDDLSRALMDMMNGTLEKKMAESEKPMERKPWMDSIPREEMTDDQRRELDRHEARELERAAEAKAHRTKLLTDLERLHSDVRDISSKLDEKVKTLYRERMDVQAILSRNEIYACQLSNAAHRNEDSIRCSLQMEGEVRSLLSKMDQMSKVSESLQADFENLRADLDRKVEEDKRIDKTFKKSIQQVSGETLDQETVRLLFQLYKKRGGSSSIRQRHRGRGKRAKGTGSRTSSVYSTAVPNITRRSLISRQSGREGSWGGPRHGGHDQGVGSDCDAADDDAILSSMKWAVSEAGEFVEEEVKSSEMDPFAVGEPTSHHSVVNKPKGLDSNESLRINIDEIPEGFAIEDKVWEKMQELRAEKLRKEAEVAAAAEAVHNMKGLCDEAKQTEDGVLMSINRIQEDLKNASEQRKRSVCNPDLLVLLKQGQDETPSGTKIADYSDAALIPTDVIECTNTEIERLGAIWAHILEKTIRLRKRISIMTWNHELLELKEKDAREQYVDWQLLRINKQLKMFLLGEHGESETVRTAKEQDQLSRREKAHKEKVQRQNKENLELEAQIQQRRVENERLAAQLQDLKSDVAARETKYNSIHTGSKSDRDRTNMTRLVKRKRLVEIVKSQEGEIATLLRQVEMLRQRTFPSFSHIVDTSHKSNPDEI